MYIILCISILATFVNSQLNDNDYFQLIDDTSFSLRDKYSHEEFLHNFNIEGSAMLIDNHLKLTPRLNNTYGLIYSKEYIFSSNIRIHLTFKINHEAYLGSAFVIWLFKDDLENYSLRNFIGFKVSFY
jgi:hypothetical protein